MPFPICICQSSLGLRWLIVICTAVLREAWTTLPESSSRPLPATLAQSRNLAHASLETAVQHSFSAKSCPSLHSQQQPGPAGNDVPICSPCLQSLPGITIKCPASIKGYVMLCIRFSRNQTWGTTQKGTRPGISPSNSSNRRAVQQIFELHITLNMPIWGPLESSSSRRFIGSFFGQADFISCNIRIS